MSHLSRRDVLRYGAAAAVVAGAVAAPNLAGSSSAAPPAAEPAANRDPRDFEIEYRGKKIKGVHGSDGTSKALRAGGHRPHEVYINDRKLAVMQIELPAAGGGVSVGYISAVNHYEPVLIDADRHQDGLRKLAKRAVDVLGDAELTPLAGVVHDHGR